MSDTKANARALLEKQALHKRGHLKIFLGMAPGVGKTFAMLTEAHELRDKGLDVVIGLVDTHGRADTAALVEGLELISRKKIIYEGHCFEELDVKAIIQRHPAIVIVDEMAHSNVPGSVHKKRWQDIEELLNEGINVYTALNIQHLESLNDIVSRVTGVKVSETIPDNVFDRASEVRLVDLPPDDLIERLNEGKIYLNEVIRHASDNYFKKSNLMALRELTLRSMVGRVDLQVKRNGAIGKTSSTGYGLMLLIDSITSQEAIREALRMARAMSSRLHCVCIDSAALLDDKQELSEIMAFASSLGAKTDALTGDFPYCIKDYANANNINVILLIPQSQRDLVKKRRLINTHMPNMSIITLPYSVKKVSIVQKLIATFKHTVNGVNDFVFSFILTGLITLLLVYLSDYIKEANLIMFYLLLTLFVAVKYGMIVSIFTSVLSVACFDLFIVNPRLSFAIADIEYLITFATILVVGIVSARLVTHSRYLSNNARMREKQTRILYTASKNLSKAMDDIEAFRQIQNILKEHLNIVSEFWKSSSDGQCIRLMTELKNVDKGLINYVQTHKKEAGFGTYTLSQSRYLYLPIMISNRLYAIAVLELQFAQQWSDPVNSRLLQALLTLLKQCLEKIVSEEESKTLLMNIEAERMRHTLIQSLSHDLKTPLSALMASAELLSNKLSVNDIKEAYEISKSVVDDSKRMVRLMSNLLDMAKLQSGQVVLNKQWLPAQEIIGSALKNFKDIACDYTVNIDIEPDCPFFYADPILIDRLLSNLLDNAFKYTNKGSCINVEAKERGDKLTLSVTDNGPGFADNNTQKLFDPFRRGGRESKISGIGLGLAICKTIARAHDSELLAFNAPEGGAAFVLVMPLVTMPYTEDIFM
ncbi:Sensor protein KdpD [Anaerobiospirillum thomasii]|uniref:sensor histidine kinase n=1 Tax=Anaerobiospirillum thomasii TaxID=179995 RepID=UPI000D9B996F|nr:sensor histidine kinase KdpD [Anaerobiospirillum thomasii]SPT67805.1 Sensor protein KdpD [Anaerobiospirillum thomasii]